MPGEGAHARHGGDVHDQPTSSGRAHERQRSGGCAHGAEEISLHDGVGLRFGCGLGVAGECVARVVDEDVNCAETCGGR